jgi:hypothetical protein
VRDDEAARRGWGWGATKAAATGGYHKRPAIGEPELVSCVASSHLKVQTFAPPRKGGAFSHGELDYIGEMQIARYFAVGVEQAPDGEFVAGKCDEALSALSAVRRARSLAHQNGGAVAFRWRGDVEFGRPGSIEILAGFGELPAEVEHLIGEA